MLFAAWFRAVKNLAPSLKRVVLLGVIFCGLVACLSAAESHAFAGAWRGHKKTGGTGVGAATLISPSWAITAKHVASKKAKTPDKVNVIISFGGGKRRNRQVKKAYLCPGADIALVRLARPITGIAPAALCKTRLNKKHGRFRFTFVSRGNGLKVVKNRWAKGNGERIYHSKDAKGQRPGKAGDSGGGWVFEQDSPEPDVLFAVIHGGGFGPQRCQQEVDRQNHGRLRRKGNLAPQAKEEENSTHRRRCPGRRNCDQIQRNSANGDHAKRPVAG